MRVTCSSDDSDTEEVVQAAGCSVGERDLKKNLEWEVSAWGLEVVDDDTDDSYDEPSDENDDEE